MAGPGYDLEAFAYKRGSYSDLPNQLPMSKIQGTQRLDFQNRHIESRQTAQMAGYHSTNPLPFERFVGTFQRHINEPLPLSVNELMFE
jgi:hypothetical protein